MAEFQIRFDDGASYERMMGTWSRLVGEIFLDWIALPRGLRCVDIGCGNGAFTELLVERCAPAEVQGIDPSEGQLAFARARPAARVAQFQRGDGMALPFPDDQFDAATMALVIFFVPTPAKGVAEMVRIVKPGGMIAAYAWDVFGGGFPLEPIQVEMRALGMKPVYPPSVDASRMGVLRSLWSEAGLESIETKNIVVERTFSDFEEFWSISITGSSIAPMIAAMSVADLDRLKTRVREKLPPDSKGRITCGAHANAVKGRVPV